jgi:hypothetical protein
MSESQPLLPIPSSSASTSTRPEETPNFLAWLIALIPAAVALVAHKLDTLLHAGVPLIWWVRLKWTIDQMGDQTGKVG